MKELKRNILMNYTKYGLMAAIFLLVLLVPIIFSLSVPNKPQPVKNQAVNHDESVLAVKVQNDDVATQPVAVCSDIGFTCRDVPYNPGEGTCFESTSSFSCGESGQLCCTQVVPSCEQMQGQCIAPNSQTCGAQIGGICEGGNYCCINGNGNFPDEDYTGPENPIGEPPQSGSDSAKPVAGEHPACDGEYWCEACPCATGTCEAKCYKKSDNSQCLTQSCSNEANNPIGSKTCEPQSSSNYATCTGTGTGQYGLTYEACTNGSACTGKGIGGCGYCQTPVNNTNPQTTVTPPASTECTAGNRGFGCHCSNVAPCSAPYVCKQTATTNVCDLPTTSPTQDACNVSTNKPNECSCTDNNQCGSNSECRLVNTGGSRVCQPKSDTSKPDPDFSGAISCTATYTFTNNQPENTQFDVTIDATSNNINCVALYLDGVMDTGKVSCSSTVAGKYTCKVNSGSAGQHALQLKFGVADKYPNISYCGAPVNCTIKNFTTGSASGQAASIMGDLNASGAVDQQDYTAFTTCVSGGTCSNRNATDLNRDGVISIIDFNLLVSRMHTVQ